MSLIRLSVLSLVIPVALGACAGVDQPQFTIARRPIINGQVDDTHPAVVALVAGSSMQFCSGTVIAPRAVLTAGHCIEESGIPTQYMSAFFGQTVTRNGGQLIQVTDAQVHPNYYVRSDGAPMNDVAVLTLAEDAPVEPMAWQRTPLADPSGATVTLVGYGVTDAQQQSGNGTRRTVDETVETMDDTFVYYGGGTSGTCQGDSGGPMFLDVNGVQTVIGVTSFGDQSCVQLGGNTRVDIFADFIAPRARLPIAMNIIWPADTSTMPSDFEVDVDVHTGAGLVGLDLYIDGIQIASLTDVPWIFQVGGLAEGPHLLEVKAIATDGAEASSSVNVTVAAVVPGTDQAGSSGGCSTGGRAPTAAGALLLLVAGLAFVRRRR